MDDLLTEFLEEARSGLVQARSRLAATGGDGDSDLAGILRDLFHTLGATSAFLDLPRLRTLALAGEAALTRLGSPPKSIPAGALETLRVAVASAETLVSGLARDGREIRGDDARLIARLTTSWDGVPSKSVASVESSGGAVPATHDKRGTPPATVSKVPALPAVPFEAPAGIRDLVADLVSVRNRLLHLGRGRDDNLDLPLSRLDAITSALVHGLGEDDDSAIVPALVLTSGRIHLVLEQAAVGEILPVPTRLGATYIHQGRPLPLARLADVLESDGNEASTPSHILIVRSDDAVFALAIEPPQAAEEVVLQSLPPALSEIPIYGGVAALGDGRVALVLAPAGLAKAIGAEPERVRLLLIDDSPFFRNLLTPVLTMAGYDVTTLPGAAEAIGLCEEGVLFDAVVCDIDMPGMTGFDLVAAVRRHDHWQETPLIGLFSDPDDRTLGGPGAPGFDAYVAKFDRDALVVALARMAPPKLAERA